VWCAQYLDDLRFYAPAPSWTCVSKYTMLTRNSAGKLLAGIRRERREMSHTQQPSVTAHDHLLITLLFIGSASGDIPT